MVKLLKMLLWKSFSDSWPLCIWPISLQRRKNYLLHTNSFAVSIANSKLRRDQEDWEEKGVVRNGEIRRTGREKGVVRNEVRRTGRRKSGQERRGQEDWEERKKWSGDCDHGKFRYKMHACSSVLTGGQSSALVTEHGGPTPLPVTRALLPGWPLPYLRPRKPAGIWPPPPLCSFGFYCTIRTVFQLTLKKRA